MSNPMMKNTMQLNSNIRCIEITGFARVLSSDSS